MPRRKIFFIALFLESLFSIEKLTEEAKREILPEIYREEILEGFERDPSSYLYAKDEGVFLQKEEGFPAYVPSSRYYLGIRFENPPPVVEIYFQKPIFISSYVRKFSLWVFGKGIFGEVSILLKDFYGKEQEVSLGKMRFYGWKKLVASLPLSIYQKDMSLSQKGFIEVLGIRFRWHLSSRKKKGYFFIDEMGALLREKYLLKEE